jgi:hypothetical protein
LEAKVNKKVIPEIILTKNKLPFNPFRFFGHPSAERKKRNRA